MKIAAALAVLSVSIALTGCAKKDLCQRSIDGCERTVMLAATCPNISSFAVPHCMDNEGAEMDACQATLASCTDADTQAMEAAIDCVQQLSACTPGQEEAFVDSVAACPLPVVTPGCLGVP